MIEYPVRCFDSAVGITRIGQAFLARTLPKSEWTHEAHFAVTVFLARAHPELDLPRVLPRLIVMHNESIGIENSETSGYHETLTRFYLASIRAFLEERPADEGLLETVSSLLASPVSRRDSPLAHWSPGRLFSAEARRRWVEPDRAHVPAAIMIFMHS